MKQVKNPRTLLLKTMYTITIATLSTSKKQKSDSSINAITIFEEYIIDNDIAEPYVHYISEDVIVVGFTYDPDSFVTLSPVPEGYEDKIHLVIEKINHKVECDSVS
jgi:hypothetical protein